MFRSSSSEARLGIVPVQLHDTTIIVHTNIAASGARSDFISLRAIKFTGRLALERTAAHVARLLFPHFVDCALGALVR